MHRVRACSGSSPEVGPSRPCMSVSSHVPRARHVPGQGRPQLRGRLRRAVGREAPRDPEPWLSSRQMSPTGRFGVCPGQADAGDARCCRRLVRSPLSESTSSQARGRPMKNSGSSSIPSAQRAKRSKPLLPRPSGRISGNTAALMPCEVGVRAPAGLSVLHRERALLYSTIGQHRLHRPSWVWAHRSALQRRR